MKNLTLIIPAKKEAESLPYVLSELYSYDLNIMIVLSEKDTETIEAIKETKSFKANITNIIFQENKGYGDALIKGINSCKTKYFSIFNADGSFDPAELEGMLNLIKKDNFDLVFGSRYQKNSGSEDDTLITFTGNYLFTYIGKIFFKLRITDILYTFVVGKTLETQNLNLNNQDFGFCVELPIKAHRKNLNIISSNSFERKRIAGKKKVNAFRDGFLILVKMIKLFFDR